MKIVSSLRALAVGGVVLAASALSAPAQESAPAGRPRAEWTLDAVLEAAAHQHPLVEAARARVDAARGVRRGAGALGFEQFIQTGIELILAGEAHGGRADVDGSRCLRGRRDSAGMIIELDEETYRTGRFDFMGLLRLDHARGLRIEKVLRAWVEEAKKKQVA
mgnify:CR=1 FL=1